ncbi:MAG: hypothetical protein C0467_26950 [Planctomycetaceae bacterium]|nr:hypothetical protein [Planctomycetaceae bacterium]
MRSSQHLTRLACTGVLVGLCVLAGCGGGSDPNLVHVSGTVTVDGKPLPLGMIVFEPDPAKGNRGQQGHADIKDGQFDTRQSGKGVALGAQVVRITGGDGVNPEPFTPFGKLLFEEHTTRTDVTKDQPPLRLDIPGQKAMKK